jgi:hypothetical protein
LKLKALRKLCNERMAAEPESIWSQVDKLIDIAEEAKRICWEGGYLTMGLAELIEDLETT